MSTRFELPLTIGNAGNVLIVNPTETGYLWVPVAPAGGQVDSVTDDANGVVIVDNTDPANPVIEFDLAQLIIDLNTSGDISVVVDGITITGDGTTANPLTAVTSGGVVVSIVGGTDISVDSTDPANPIVNFTGSPGVQSVTDDGGGVVVVDNIDPVNPVIGFAGVDVDGSTITGDGTSGNPLVATAQADVFVKVDAADTTTGYLDDKIEIVDGVNTTVVKTILNIGGNEKIRYQINASGGGGLGGGYLVDQTPDNGTYGLLSGAVDGFNTTFTVLAGEYLTGTLVVALNGLVQLQGAADDWEETSPAAGTFDFITPPVLNDIITVWYQTSNTIAQTGIEFQDEGTPLGTPGTVQVVDFVGAGVTATRIGNDVTVTIPGGGGSFAQAVEQYIGGATDGTNSALLLLEINSDGSVMYTVSYEDPSFYVKRYEKDSISGLYYETHQSSSLPTNGGSVRGIVLLGSYVYVFRNASSGTIRRCIRMDAADLTNEITMTIVGGSTAAWNSSGAFTDGADLFPHVSSSPNEFDQFSVLGTTMTFVQTITGATTSTVDAIYDTTTNKVYLFGIDGELDEYSLSGSTLTLDSSTSRYIPGVPVNGGAMSGVNPNAVVLSFNTQNSETDTNGSLLKVFSK